MFKIINSYMSLLFLGFSLAYGAEIPSQSYIVPVNKAFQLTEGRLDLKEKKLVFTWAITPGYYLYQNKFSIEACSPAKLGAMKFDPPQWSKGNHSVAWYGTDTQIQVPILQAPKGILSVAVTYQGCSEHGFCYPPIHQILEISIPEPIQIHNTSNPSESWSSGLSALGLLGYGLLLSLTPCVLPMFPLILNFLVGTRTTHSYRSYWLALTYILSMSLMYALAGCMTALLGHSIQNVFQKPSILIGLSLWLFLLTCMQWSWLPQYAGARLNSWLYQQQERIRGGSLFRAFLLGAIAAFILSPCVTPPILGILGVIAQQGDWLLGAFYLWCLALGMGLPLLAIALLGAQILPKSGPWLVHINTCVGLFLLLLSFDLLGRTLSLYWMNIVGILLCLCLAIRLFTTSKSWIGQMGSLILLLLVVWSSAQQIQQKPSLLERWHEYRYPELVLSHKVSKLTDFKKLLQEAQEREQFSILEISADWCPSCQHQKRFLWSHPAVANALENIQFIRADVTDQGPAQQAILLYFNLYGPPALLFFDQKGVEQSHLRLIGEASVETFLEQLRLLQLDKR